MSFLFVVIFVRSTSFLFEQRHFRYVGTAIPAFFLAEQRSMCIFGIKKSARLRLGFFLNEVRGSKRRSTERFNMTMPPFSSTLDHRDIVLQEDIGDLSDDLPPLVPTVALRLVHRLKKEICCT